MLLGISTIYQKVPYGSIRLGEESEDRQVSLLVLTLAQDPRLRGKVLRKGHRPPGTEWVAKIKTVRRRLEVRCAHLLDEKHCLVRLIHRSAKEFLETTPDGLRILGHDESTPEDCIADLVSAEIALTRLDLTTMLAMPLWKRPSLATVVRRLCRLCRQDHLPAARALELMSHVEDIATQYHGACSARQGSGGR